MGPSAKVRKLIEIHCALNSRLKEILLILLVNDQDDCAQYEVCEGQATQLKMKLLQAEDDFKFLSNAE